MLIGQDGYGILVRDLWWVKHWKVGSVEELSCIGKASLVVRSAYFHGFGFPPESLTPSPCYGQA
jgi:hypothetical protein